MEDNDKWTGKVEIRRAERVTEVEEDEMEAVGKEA